MYYKDFLIDYKYKELKDRELYQTYIEIFYVSAIIGCLLNKQILKVKTVESNSGFRGRIEKSIFITNEKNYKPYIQMIGILHYTRKGEKDQGIRKVFIESESEKKEIMEIIESYARGGIDVLYQNLVGDATNDQQIVKKAKDFMLDFEEIVPYYACLDGKTFDDVIREGM